MYDLMRGVRVVEVASWTFVPAAGAIFADWGADVLKVEHPESGDPQRGLMVFPLPVGAPNPLIDQPNRGKRSIAIDFTHPEGRELLYRLVETADVFLTNLLTPALQRAQIDIEHLTARNPRLIYVRGTGQGTHGPDADTGGFDMASAWCRAGIGYKLTPPGAAAPVNQGSAAFVDLIGGMTIAGGIAAALYHRERTGEALAVDVSLFGTGSWIMSPDILASAHIGETVPAPDRTSANSPVVNTYRTKDDRWLVLVLLQADRFWAELCQRIGRPELAEDPRFADMATRHANRHECIKALDAAFAERTLDEWHAAFDGFRAVWSPMRSPLEVHNDPQTAPNGVLAEVGDDPGRQVVASPVRFGDASLGTVAPPPAHGDHTDEVLRELGIDDEALLDLKLSGAVG